MAIKKKIIRKKQSINKKKIAKKKAATRKKVMPKKKRASTKKKVIKRKKVATTKKKSTKKKATSKKRLTKQKKSSTKTKKSAIKKKAAAGKKISKVAKPSARMISTKKKSSIQSKHSHMNQKNLGYFKTELLKHKDELMKEVDRTVVHMQTESANYADANDRATQEEEFGRELKNRDRERKLIKKINDAIARIDNYTFGYCEECGVSIGMVRLRARPTTTMCVDCKSLAEVIEKQG